MDFLCLVNNVPFDKLYSGNVGCLPYSVFVVLAVVVVVFGCFFQQQLKMIKS